jgi:membrane protein YqaA with SNARE-associated domain
MTAVRTAIAGALALNVPSVYGATALPIGAVAISVVALAIVGAVLGAVTGWAIERTPGTTASVYELRRPERLAA